MTVVNGWLKSRRWLALSIGATATAVVVGLTTLGSHAMTAEAALGGNSTAAEKADTAARADMVPFDHTIHVGQYKMRCLACHVYARLSTTAGIPSVRRCMGCHKFVDKKKPGVKRLAALWEKHEPPRWRRVYNLPDFVYFSHRVHVAANVACTSCHGDVGSMHKVTQQQQLTMGWCLSCHTKRKASTDCLVCHK